jgi:hypothetical protein
VAYLDEDDVTTAYQEASDEADQWRLDYPQYERLADNGLLDDLDENLPEVNDGSLAASLFKLSKRVIRKKIGGQAVAINRDEAWMTELANIYWNKKILPNANSKATPRRKWKDAVRKAAIYGGQPVIDLFLTRGNYTGADFIVPYAQDVKLEAGKDSDQDSDIIFWDIYYSKSQLEDMIATAEQEIADGISKIRVREDDNSPDEGDGTALGENADTHKPRTSPEDAQTPAKRSASAKVKTNPTTSEPADNENDSEDYAEGGQEEVQNYWDIELLKQILSGDPEEQRPGNETPKAEQTSGQKKTGYHFYIAWQRGVQAPFMMIHASRNKCVREWVNDDPTGDIPCHYLYCYQDFINPYGIGIVKLAGGTQNVLDYMRQADILATQLGLRPPKQIIGDEDQVDEDSLVYAQDANWYVGTAKVERMEMANGVYAQLPGRINMYQTSLQKMLPTGDTTISETNSGDSTQSKTPAGVKLAAANLSIDDEDFAENVDECYAMVARRMINCQFANMEGTDLMKLSDDERDTLVKAGLQFPEGSQELQIIWDHTRAHFDFEIDPSTRFMTTDQEQQAMLEAVLQQATPQVIWALGKSGWKFDLGEAYYAAFSKMNLENFASIISKMTDEEKQQAAQAPFPIIDPPQIRLTGQIPNGAMGAALASGGVEVDPKTPMIQDQLDLGDLLKDVNTTPAEKAQIKILGGITPSPLDPTQGDPHTPTPPTDGSAATTPAAAPADTGLTANESANLALKADQQAHDQNMDKTKLALEITKAATPPPATQVPGETRTKATKPAATTPAAGQSDTAQIATKANENIKQIMSLYHVDANTAMAMLEAERQGYSPQEILLALSRHKIGTKRGGGGSNITPGAPVPADLPTGVPANTVPAPGGAR